MDKTTDYIKIGEEEISKFDLLAMAANQENKAEARKLLRIASKLFHAQDDPTFNALFGAVATEIAVFGKTNEFTLHSAFNREVKTLLGKDARIIKKINDIRHQPDSWVELAGQELPVEIKLKKFDEKALSQLQRYMSFYGSPKGIAVAAELTVEIPENIIFIASDRIDPGN